MTELKFFGTFRINSVDVVFKSQRTGDEKLFLPGEIVVQNENYSKDGIVVVRGKYPNDEYFATVKVDLLVPEFENEFDEKVFELRKAWEKLNEANIRGKVPKLAMKTEFEKMLKETEKFMVAYYG